jgi:hypothetical protein
VDSFAASVYPEPAPASLVIPPLADLSAPPPGRHEAPGSDADEEQLDALFSARDLPAQPAIRSAEARKARRRVHAWLSEHRASLGASYPELDADIAFAEDGLQGGFSLNSSTRPDSLAHVQLELGPVNDDDANAIRRTLHEYLSIDAIARVSEEDLRTRPGPLSPLLLVRKETFDPTSNTFVTKLRCVVDLTRSGVNATITPPLEEFRLPRFTDAVKDCDTDSDVWMALVDLAHAFLSVPLRFEDRAFTRFRFEGTTYEFTTLPFGAASSPARLHQLLRPVRKFLEARHGMSILVYLDDIFIRATSQAEAYAHLGILLNLLWDHGWVVRRSKVQPPSRQVRFLGVHLCSISRRFLLGNDRVAGLTAAIQAALGQQRLSRQAAESLLGRLSFAAQVIPATRPFVSALHDLVSREGAQQPARFSLRPTSTLRETLERWVDILHADSWQLSAFWPSTRRLTTTVAYTDASLDGWSVFVAAVHTHSRETAQWATALPPHLAAGAAIAGAWSDADHGDLREARFMSVLELFSVAFCVAWLSSSRPVGSRFLIFCDNAGAVDAWAARRGRCRRVNAIVLAISATLLRKNQSLTLRHIATEDNQVADFLSRPTDWPEPWAREHPGAALSSPLSPPVSHPSSQSSSSLSPARTRSLVSSDRLWWPATHSFHSPPLPPHHHLIFAVRAALRLAAPWPPPTARTRGTQRPLALN